MDARDLAKIDLNLLISMQVLLEEQNVSRAAERLFITQPAMSKTLSRLRTVFSDPLFTRSSHGMTPTPRAQELGRRLEPILGDILALLNREEFDPATYSGELTIALSEYIGIGILPKLMARLQFLAPALGLRSITRAEQQLDQLAAGDLDFAIHIRHSNYLEDFQTHSLGSNAPVILAREGHPLSGTTPSWDSLSLYPFIRLYISDMEETEIFQRARRLGELPEPDGGRFETSHLLTALEVLRATDYLMPGPPYILQNPTVGYKIQALAMPEQDHFDLEYVLVRHRRTEKSEVHNWLWSQLLDIIQELQLAQPGRSIEQLLTSPS